jgi:Fe-S-cluster containining protein
LLTPADIAALAKHLQLTEDDFVQRHTTLAANRAQLTLVDQAGGACCFLGLDNACRVYPARPQQCREFPHTWRVSGCPAMPA